MYSEKRNDSIEVKKGELSSERNDEVQESSEALESVRH